MAYVSPVFVLAVPGTVLQVSDSLHKYGAVCGQWMQAPVVGVVLPKFFRINSFRNCVVVEIWALRAFKKARNFFFNQRLSLGDGFIGSLGVTFFGRVDGLFNVQGYIGMYFLAGSFTFSKIFTVKGNVQANDEKFIWFFQLVVLFV